MVFVIVAGLLLLFLCVVAVVESLSYVCLRAHTGLKRSAYQNQFCVSGDFRLCHPRSPLIYKKVQESDSLKVCIFKHKPLDSGCVLQKKFFQR